MSQINDLIGLVIEKNPTQFEEAFNELISEKVMAALEERQLDIAASLYVEDFDEEDFDEEIEEDFDEEDEFDEDLDLDDLDISDLDDEFEDIDLDENA